jgi:hypothetical protein
MHTPNYLLNTLSSVAANVEYKSARIDSLGLKDKCTLERLACDRNTPVSLLERLAQHPLADVRAAVSDNENAPLKILWTLAQDEDANVRCQLAENHNLPLALIRSLTDDENPYVACRAQKTYDRLRAS